MPDLLNPADDMQLNDKIKSLYPSFTKTEKMIANFFLDLDNYSLPDYTLEELAKKLRVGQSTIMRFIHKCGYTSLRTFLVDFTASRYISTIDRRSALQNNMGEVFHNVEEKIRSLSCNLNLTLLAEIAEKILEADVIICMGTGYSGFMADLAAYRFMRGSFFALSHSSQLKSWEAHTILKNRKAVVIIFSISGETTDQLETIRHYQMEENTYLVALTSYINSTIARLADAPIYIPSSELLSNRDASVDGMINMILAIEMIIIQCFKIKQTEEE